MTWLAAATATEPGAAYELGRTLGGLAIGALSARRGYLKAERVSRETGQLPRGWSPTTWSGLCFASLLIGHVWLASAAGKARAVPRPVADPVPVGPDPRFSWGASDASSDWTRSVPPQPVAEEGPAPVTAAPAPPAPPVPLPPPVPAVVMAPPKPFSMNPRPVWPTEPLPAPPAAAPAPAAAVPSQPLPSVALAPPAPAPVEAPVPAAEVTPDLAPLAAPIVPAVQDPVVLDPAPPADVAAPQWPAAEPETVSPLADESVVPVEVPRVVSMDVLPAAAGKRRR